MSDCIMSLSRWQKLRAHRTVKAVWRWVFDVSAVMVVSAAKAGSLDAARVGAGGLKLSGVY